jgi:hypothetical protein
MRFSDRIGKTKGKSIIQIDSMDEDLRNSLWNSFYIFFGQKIESERLTTTKETSYYLFFMKIWESLFKESIDSIPYQYWDALKYLKDYFFQCTWFEAYNFIEFICSTHSPTNIDGFISHTNYVLEREMSGFRFIDNKLAPITSESEIMEIEDAISQTSGETLDGVNLHLKSALSLLSDRKNPDYRNSIKESISAVEAICKIIAEDEKTTLAKALTKLKRKIDIHGSLEEGFKKIYGYTSDADGIRHAIMYKPNIDFADAKYMMVSCSAFINYLISKSNLNT